MSYLMQQRYGKKRAAPRAMVKRAPMGDVISDIESALSTGTTLASDPYTTEVMCHFEQLAQIHNNQTPQACTEVPDGTPSPAGLSQYIYPLRALVWLQANPWGYALVLGVLFGIPIYIGYDMGYEDGSRRSRPATAIKPVTVKP